ncbi:diablo, IAP-binding mitochondrial protein b [Hypomesus transpacificus]|uniref:diablo, IAP-binding mitochondrial protein b n=1 Tax=Hypomesus transpacificus TaxID=137520 RepID=UPI001F087C44|nr:diablo, IAP-binding mitochondrial protein b [Hypomesus transpacificus]
MAAFRAGIVCVGLRHCALNLMKVSLSLIPRRVVKLPVAIRKNWFSLTAATGGLCAVPFAVRQEGLSHESLIRRASSLVTDSTNTFLSQTTLALVDSLTQYIKAINTIVTLHRNYVSSASRLTPAEEEAVWQVIIRQRQEIKDLFEDCKKFESNWMMAKALSELAAETAFNAGADQACVTAKSSLQVAMAHVEQTRQLSLEAEENLKESNADNSERVTLPAAMETGEDDDIPDAYLRED